eukprot:scaffold472246_cov240-Attheya_sp.AAC.1
MQRAAAGQPTTASASSISRWNRRLLPYRITGNQERGRLVGADLLLLAICITVYPKGSCDDIAMFIFQEG